MEARIANFELLWARVYLGPVPPPAPLVRQTNAFWGLSPEDQARWTAAATHEERVIIEQEDRNKYGLDDEKRWEQAEQGAAAEQAEEQAEAQTRQPVPYYECDDDDDMRWVE